MLASLRTTLTGWHIQQRSILALSVRDIMMRYGRQHLGFLWVVLEPMLLTVGVLVLWSAIRGGYEHGLRVAELVLTGYMLLTLWRHLTNSTILLFRRSASLLYHRQVSLFDIFFSRMLVEFTSTTTALVLVMATMSLLGLINPVQDWTLFLAGWLLMAFLASGVGALVLVATESNEAAEKFVQPVQYILIPLSGTFFMVDWLPTSAQGLILWNPVVHTYEMLRGGFFGAAVETHYSVAYLFAWGFGLNFVGVWAMHRIRRTLQIV